MLKILVQIHSQYERKTWLYIAREMTIAIGMKNEITSGFDGVAHTLLRCWGNNRIEIANIFILQGSSAKFDVRKTEKS